MAFGMLTFRAWEIRTTRVSIPENIEKIAPDLSFRHVEKSMLYLTKHLVQSIVLGLVKYWFIITTKSKKWIADKWPKIYSYFEKKKDGASEPTKPSFFQKAILESKAKIKRIREKVEKEHK
ncbi:MAG: hypothetical protein AAB477_03375 [Patescibacteria group bacterium]